MEIVLNGKRRPYDRCIDTDDASPWKRSCPSPVVVSERYGWPGEKRVNMNILLWLRMKWLKLQQERIEREIYRKNLHWSDAAARPIYEHLTAVTRQKNALRERLGRRTD